MATKTKILHSSSTILLPLLFCHLFTSTFAQFDMIGDAEDNFQQTDEIHAAAAVSAQQTGGNYASYNEACSTSFSSGKLCISSRNLICKDGLCKCDTNKDNYNIPLIYVNHSNVQNCLPVASDRNNWICVWDPQCTEGKYGKYSKCSNGHCICADTEGKNRQVIEYENTCFVSKNIGSSCEDDVQCNVTISGEAICLGTRSNLGLCQCASDWAQLSSNECLQLKSINQPCVHDLQCNSTNSLGSLARCSNGACACADTSDSPYRTNTSYYIPKPNPNLLPGKCYYVKRVNETCNSVEECILGYHPKAICSPHESYNGEKVCQCPPNEKCGCNSKLLISGCTGIIFIILAFAFK